MKLAPLLIAVLLSACTSNHSSPRRPIIPVVDAATIYPPAVSARIMPVPFNKPVPRPVAKINHSTINMNAPVTHWYWPAHGKVSSSRKGINIRGKIGDPVLAAASGKVVYSGHGLRGYGNLIIIKHNNTFLTAYAYNKTALVKEGDRVAAKQKIAEMGRTGSNHTELHFEIRSHGQSVNPLIYLTRRV